jgi:hypothetical protein
MDETNSFEFFEPATRAIAAPGPVRPVMNASGCIGPAVLHSAICMLGSSKAAPHVMLIPSGPPSPTGYGGETLAAYPLVLQALQFFLMSRSGDVEGTAEGVPLPACQHTTRESAPALSSEQITLQIDAP